MGRKITDALERQEPPGHALRVETVRLILRPLAEPDAAAMSQNSKNPAAARFMSDMVWETEGAARGFIRWYNTEKYNVDIPSVILAVTLKPGGEVIGFVGVGPKAELDNEIELGYLIAEGRQNNGYATEACKAIIWWAFEKAGQDALSAIASPENRASRRVLEKLGFVYEGARSIDGNGGAQYYYRIYNMDSLPGPEWDAGNLYKPETMGAFFDARAESYNDHMLSELDDEGDYEKLGAYFPKTDEAIRILDIGCGTGIELDYIWVRSPNAHITCVDVSSGMLDILLKNHPNSHDRITIIEASYTDWTYPEALYDIVVSNMTMHHLWPDEKINVYRGVLGALKPGGFYIEGDFIVDGNLAKIYRRRYEVIAASLAGKANPGEFDRSDLGEFDKPGPGEFDRLDPGEFVSPDPGGITKPKPGEYHIDIPETLETQIKLLHDAGFSDVNVLDDSINHGSGAIIKAYRGPGA